MKKSILCAAVAVAFTGSVYAAEPAIAEGYLGSGYYFWDSERKLENTNSMEGGLEIPVTENISAGVWLSDFKADYKNSSADINGRRYSIGGLYHFTDGDTVPYISTAISYLKFKHNRFSSFDENLLSLGVGLKHYFDNNVVLRGEALVFNSLDNEFYDAGLRLSAGYAFGRTSGSVAEPIPMAPVVKKEPVPEPVKPVVVAKPVPAPAPIDSDNDGVVDGADRCPGTAAKLKVDSQGCPIMLTEAVSIEVRVLFPTASAIVAPDYFSEINKVAEFMAQYEGTVVTVEGHTDDRGKDAYNKALSQRRADAVRKVLIETYSVAADRVTAVGYGEERPIADNATDEGRTKNRRVVGVIKSEFKKPATK